MYYRSDMLIRSVARIKFIEKKEIGTRSFWLGVLPGSV